MQFAFAIHSFSVCSPPDCELGRNTLRFEPPFDNPGRLLQPSPCRRPSRASSHVDPALPRLTERATIPAHSPAHNSKAVREAFAQRIAAAIQQLGR
jgi:hypothetical protein